MPRKPRQGSSTGVYHWITRGMNRKALFHFREDYLHFLDLIRDHSKEHEILVYHYCLMPNHVHMLLYAPNVASLSKFSHFLKRCYAYYHSKTAKHQGASFERMYKSLPIEDNAYLLECGRYIERNPLRANLASRPDEYEYSSYAYYAFGRDSDILTTSPSYSALAEDKFTRQKLYSDYVTSFRPQEEYASANKFAG